MRGWIAYEEKKSIYQPRSRSIGVRFEVLHDVSVVAPVVDESELECRHVNAMERENVIMNQSLPYRYEFPEDLLCFPKILRRVDKKGFEGHRLVVQNPSPNIGSPTRCYGNFSASLEPLKCPDGVGEQPCVAGDLP